MVNHSIKGCARMAALVLLLTTAFTFLERQSVYGAPGDELVASGKAKYQAADYDGAIQALTQFVNQYPTSADRNVAELYLGCSFLMRKNGVDPADNTLARQHFQFIMNQGKAETYYREAAFHNARSYYCEKNYAPAIPLLRQYLVDFPSDDFNRFAYYYLGVCESQTGAFEAAVADLDAALALIPQQDSTLRSYCLLEKATIAGKLGQYAAADSQLAQIYAAGTPSDSVGQAANQRALLKLAQHRQDDAINILNDYIARYGADPASAQTVQEAYVYMAYCYFAKNDPVSALQIVEQLEKVAQTLPPEAATLKIKLLLNLKRIQEAETLLNQLAQSSYGQTLPDLITLYRAMVSLAKGDRNAVISSLSSMLQTQQLQTNPPKLVFGYFQTQRNYLAPLDFTEACGILTLALAGRYANNPNRAATPNADPDYNGQEAVFQAASEYVKSQNDPALDLIIDAVDQGRKKILANPNTNQPTQEGLSVLGPIYGVQNPNAMGAGSFSNPSDPQTFQNPGLTNAAPSFSGYGPAGQQAPNAQQGSTPQQGTTPGFLQNAANPNLTPNPNNQGNLVANQTPAPNQTANYPAQNQPNANQPTNSTVPGGQPASPLNPQQNPQQQGAVANADGNVNPNQPQVQQANANDAPQKLTPEEARDALKKATSYYQNLEFDRANDVLLETTMKSETFWNDCPAEAAKITILRANALLELDKRSEAEMICKDLVEHDPNSPEAALANFYLGSLADSVGRSSDAIDYLRAATRGRADFPYSDVALYYLGTNELERGAVTDAAQTFEKLYKNYPESAYWSHGAWRLAKIESDRRNDVVAERIVNDALAHRPDVAIIDYLLFLKGEIALRAKDYDKALVAFDMIVDQYPESVWYSRAKNRLAAIPETYKEDVEFLEDDLDYGIEDDFAPIPPASAPNMTRSAPDLFDRQNARPTRNSVEQPANASQTTNPAPTNRGQNRENNAPTDTRANQRNATNPASAGSTSSTPTSSSPRAGTPLPASNSTNSPRGSR